MGHDPRTVFVARVGVGRPFATAAVRRHGHDEERGQDEPRAANDVSRCRDLLRLVRCAGTTGGRADRIAPAAHGLTRTLPHIPRARAPATWSDTCSGTGTCPLRGSDAGRARPRAATRRRTSSRRRRRRCGTCRRPATSRRCPGSTVTAAGDHRVRDPAARDGRAQRGRRRTRPRGCTHSTAAAIARTDLDPTQDDRTGGFTRRTASTRRFARRSTAGS